MPYIICNYPTTSEIFISGMGVGISLVILVLEVKRRNKETEQSQIRIVQYADIISNIFGDIYRNGKGIDKDDGDSINEAESGSYFKEYLLSQHDVLRQRYDDLNLIFNLAKFKNDNYSNSVVNILDKTDWVLNDWILKIKSDDSLENMQDLYTQFCTKHNSRFAIDLSNIKKHTKNIYAR